MKTQDSFLRFFVDICESTCYKVCIDSKERESHMTNFEMFTDARNAAVEAVANEFIGRGFTDLEELFNCVMGDLDSLSECQVFEEATDTAVREAVWVFCQESFVNGKSVANV